MKQLWTREGAEGESIAFVPEQDADDKTIVVQEGTEGETILEQESAEG